MVGAWRKSRAWSHADLAERVGVSRPAVAQWESGRTSPSESNIRALARVFGVSVADFYRGPLKPERVAG
jgi:transcriptional regulator with XRE-family HTH domain